VDEQNAQPPVRFRAVIEMAFPDADPWDPEDYGKLIGQWKQMIESNPIVNCKDVKIKEVLTIGDIDDYEDWRNRKGEYHPHNRGPGVGVIQGVTYPVPAVDAGDLARVWDAVIVQQRGGTSIERLCGSGVNAAALMTRCIFLSVLRDEGHLPDWENDPARAENIFRHGATFPLDGPDQKTAVAFISTLPDQ
jgi:hypothetical protein